MYRKDVSGSVAQKRVRLGTTMLPGPQPSPCSEIRLACYLNPSSVKKGSVGGKPLSRSQRPVTLGQRVREKKRGK